MKKKTLFCLSNGDVFCNNTNLRFENKSDLEKALADVVEKLQSGMSVYIKLESFDVETHDVSDIDNCITAIMKGALKK